MNSRQPKKPEYSSVKVFLVGLCRQTKQPKCCRKRVNFCGVSLYLASLASYSRNRFFGNCVSHLSSWFVFVLQIRKCFYWETLTSCECPVAVYFPGKYINLTLALLCLRGGLFFYFRQRRAQNVSKWWLSVWKCLSLCFRLIVCFLLVTSLVVKPAILYSAAYSAYWLRFHFILAART